MTKALRIFLAVFTVYRLASLVSSDEGPYLGFYRPKDMGIFEWIRMKAGVYDIGPDGKPETNFARGLSCPLCTGVYISFATVALVSFPTRIGDLLLTWLGLSGAQVLLENLTSDEAIQGAIEEVAESVEAEN